MTWDITQLQDELKRLLQTGLVGFYESFEVTEIVAFHADKKEPINLLSLFVGEPSASPKGGVSTLQCLNPDRIEVKGIDWKFGVFRYRTSPQFLFDVIQRYASEGLWKTGQKPMTVGRLSAVTPQFVHPNFNDPHPWNGVLKNNFWEGSHILELFDTKKENVRVLMNESRLLTELAQRVRAVVPIDIDGLSDRLGNIVVQLPVTVISTYVKGSKEGDQNFQIAWHPKATPRPLRVLSEIYDDFTVDAFDTKTIGSQPVKLNLRSPGGGARTIIWDDANSVLLGASPVQTFVLAAGIGVHVVGEDDAAERTRKFFLPDSTGTQQPESVELNAQEKYNFVGSAPDRPRDPWRQRRMFKLSARALQDSKEFVQYGHHTGAMREQALEDVRWLIAKHGTSGAWLWDPFLCASDVLHTLFFCPHKDVDLRALSNGDEPPEDKVDVAGKTQQAVMPAPTLVPAAATPKASTRSDEWNSEQHDMLVSAAGNRLGLQLEFRVRSKGAGWPFHDRFLIFPREDGPALAWSLGTSVNSLGRSHHILQKVGNGELVHNAFLSLWDRLSSPEHNIWQS